jgi:hypothetical protein
VDPGNTKLRDGIGIVFFNHGGNCWQAVRTDGKETILFTGVAPDVAEKFTAYLRERGPITSVADVHEILEYARKELNLGDRQEKKTEAVLKETSPVDGATPLTEDPKAAGGYVITTKPDRHKAMYVAEPFFCDGAAAETHPNGGFVITNGRYVWAVKTEAFLTGFKQLDASGAEQQVDFAEVPRLPKA